MRLFGSLILLTLWCATAREAAAEELRLSMQEAIRTAIEQSPELVMLRQDLARASARIELEEGFFHPSLVADVTGTYLDQPGGTSTYDEVRKRVLGSVGLEGTLVTGLRYAVGLELLWEDVDSAFSAFRRGQTLQFRLEATQPLLRGGWLGPNRAPIVIRSIEEKATRAQSYARAIELLANVESIYWRLVLAREELKVQRDSLELAERQVDLSRTRRRLGAVSSIEVLESEAAVSRQQGEIEGAIVNVAQAEARLLGVILAPEQRKTELTLVPTDQPTVKELATSAIEDLEIAYRERQELVAADARVEAAAAALELARDATLPALDLVVGANVTGFSGILAEDAPLDVNSDPDLVGNFGDLFPNTRHPTGFVGLRLELPLTNDRAEAAEKIAAAERRKREAASEDLKNEIYSEILVARRTLQADLRRVASANVLVERTEALLKGQRESFKAGAAVSFDVVRAILDVTRARIEVLRALVRAEISHSRLLLAKGQYLSAHGIEIELGSK